MADDVIAFRVGSLEDRCDALHSKIVTVETEAGKRIDRATDDLVGVRLDMREMKAVIRFWGGLVVIATPLLATLGAWVVLSVKPSPGAVASAPPAATSSPPIATATASKP